MITPEEAREQAQAALDAETERADREREAAVLVEAREREAYRALHYDRWLEEVEADIRSRSEEGAFSVDWERQDGTRYVYRVVHEIEGYLREQGYKVVMEVADDGRLVTTPGTSGEDVHTAPATWYRARLEIGWK